jgi:hypothetical protein
MAGTTVTSGRGGSLASVDLDAPGRGVGHGGGVAQAQGGPHSVGIKGTSANIRAGSTSCRRGRCCSVLERGGREVGGVGTGRR